MTVRCQWNMKPIIWINSELLFRLVCLEEEIEELISESKADGVYEDMKEEIEQDIYRSKHLETFSLCI